MSDRPLDADGRGLPPLQVERLYQPDRLAMLAALRVVLGLPRVIPNVGDDLLSDAT